MAQDKTIEEITPEQAEQISLCLEKWADLMIQPIDREKATALLNEICTSKGEPPIVVFAESFENLVELVKDHLNKANLQLWGWRNSSPDMLHYSTDFHGSLARLALPLRSRHRLKAGLLTYSQQMKYFKSKIDMELSILFGVELVKQLNAKRSIDSHIEYSHLTEGKYLYYATLAGETFDGLNPQKYFDLIINLPVTFFVGKFVFVCEKPQISSSYDTLHSTIKPAVAWNDSTGFYYLHSVRFEKDLWETVVSGQITFHEILKIKDNDQRHQAIWCNPNAFFALEPKLIDKSENENELYLVENNELNEIYYSPKMWFLRYHDGRLPLKSWAIEEIDPAYAEANPFADVLLEYHQEFREIYTMTYAEERQYWLSKT